ncbi:MAG: hypothetical protein AAB883_01330, partial [Patescibacteria group bacterium]
MGRSIIEVLADDPAGIRTAAAQYFRAVARLLHPDLNPESERMELFAVINGACQQLDGALDEELLGWVKEFLGRDEQAVFERSFAAQTQRNSEASLERQVIELRQEVERTELRMKVALVEQQYINDGNVALLTVALPRRVWPKCKAVFVRELFDNLFLTTTRMVSGQTRQAKQDNLVKRVEYNLLFLRKDGQVWSDSRTLKFAPVVERLSTTEEAMMRPFDQIPELLRQQGRRDLLELREGIFGSAKYRGLAIGFHSGSRTDDAGSRQVGVYLRQVGLIHDLLNEASQPNRLDDPNTL